MSNLVKVTIFTDGKMDVDISLDTLRAALGERTKPPTPDFIGPMCPYEHVIFCRSLESARFAIKCNSSNLDFHLNNLFSNRHVGDEHEQSGVLHWPGTECESKH